MSDPNTFAELIERWRSPEYDRPYRGPAYCADELAALASHYVSKTKVRELRDAMRKRAKQQWEDGDNGQSVQSEADADALTALLEEAGK